MGNRPDGLIRKEEEEEEELMYIERWWVGMGLVETAV
jgi:hypothetical protein